jgi:hypothetical protein
MAAYYWMWVESEEELLRTYSGMPDVLKARALELLRTGHKLQVGSMWYANQTHYQLRYTPVYQEGSK